MFTFRGTGKGGENRCAPFFQQLTPSFADLALYQPIVNRYGENRLVSRRAPIRREGATTCTFLKKIYSQKTMFRKRIIKERTNFFVFFETSRFPKCSESEVSV